MKRILVVAALLLSVAADRPARAAAAFPYLPPDHAAAAARYAAWQPSSATLQMLEKAGLPRYLAVVPAGEAYEAAMNRFSSSLRANRQHSGAMLEDVVVAAQSAKRID